jgi:hypothetical protein
LAPGVFIRTGRAYNRPKDEPEIRIGGHLGDVSVAENGDLLGHGVNIATRLIGLAVSFARNERCCLCSSRSKGRYWSRSAGDLANVGLVLESSTKTQVIFKAGPTAGLKSPITMERQYS